MASASGDTPAAKQAHKGWPKVHLIYYALAAFNIAAAIAALYLSHVQGEIYAMNALSHDKWDKLYEQAQSLNSKASALSLPAASVFRTGNAAVERKQLDAAAKDFADALEALRNEVSSSTPEMIASHPLKTIAYVQQASAPPIKLARETLDLFERGDSAGASRAFLNYERAATSLRKSLADVGSAVRGIEDAYSAGFHAKAAKLKRYEWIIGGWLMFTVICMLLHGQSISRLMRRKYAEISAAHDQLHEALKETAAHAASVENVNDDVSKLNRELHANMQKLRDAQDEIVRKSKMAQLGQLTATVAHELRNPLGAVKTSAFLLTRKLKDKGLGVEPQLQRIDSGINRCDNIITQLLDFSRTKQLSLEPVDFDQWLGSTLEEQAASLPASIAIMCDLGLDGRKVPIDLPRMQRVVVNLLSNAAEALSRKSDGTVTDVVRDPRIRIETKSADGGGITLSVSDNGPGISEENLRKIREPLFTTKNFGTGLGIPAIEQILAQHGGHLEITSKEGDGATFTTWLPAEAQPLRRAS
ncbi:MAG: sensor histidine kinase [Aestuariivirga sp.]